MIDMEELDLFDKLLMEASTLVQATKTAEGKEILMAMQFTKSSEDKK